jgi:putative ABC transport system permease protein
MIYAGNTQQVAVVGATQSLADATHIQLTQGRFISDLDNGENYCVLGYQLYQSLQLLMPNPIGQQIRLSNSIFTVIGVAKPWSENSFFNQDINSAIIIPIKAAILLNQYATIDNFILRLVKGSDIQQVQATITHYFAVYAPDKQLFFRSAEALIKSMIAQHKIFTLLLGLIGGISLLVGGIGVMNIMLVSVLERRREIGIRLALGARKRDIQALFLSEAVLLALIGGIIGIVAGIIGSFIIAELAHWQFSIFIWPVLVGFSVSVLVGIVFGFYPAHQAAKLDPIETLRME